MSVPLHQRIRRGIEERILSGALAPGDRLATEHALMAEYGCSRMTVSKALSALAAEGLIERRRRAGSFVARPRLHAMVLDVPDLVQEVASRGQAYRFARLERRIGPPPTGEGDLFDLGTGRVLEIAGLHYADDRPLAIERRIISLRAVPDAAGVPFAEEPPGTWLLRRVPWTEAETRIRALAADANAARLLGVEPGAPLLGIERRTWRGRDPITAVRQDFRAEAYDLFARFQAAAPTRQAD